VYPFDYNETSKALFSHNTQVVVALWSEGGGAFTVAS